MKKIIGKVTEDEKNEFKTLYERRQLLSGMTALINNPCSACKEDDGLTNEEYDFLYEKLIDNIDKTKLLSDNWWQDKIKKYQLQSPEDAIYMIEYFSNEIFYIER